MYEYRVNIIKVIDGDTADVDIDLGFGVVLTDERVRIMGIDTPESRTSDKVEKVFGKAAKKALQDMLGETAILKTQILILNILLPLNQNHITVEVRNGRFLMGRKVSSQNN